MENSSNRPYDFKIGEIDSELIVSTLDIFELDLLLRLKDQRAITDSFQSEAVTWPWQLLDKNSTNLASELAICAWLISADSLLPDYIELDSMERTKEIDLVVSSASLTYCIVYQQLKDEGVKVRDLEQNDSTFLTVFNQLKGISRDDSRRFGARLFYSSTEAYEQVQEFWEPAADQMCDFLEADPEQSKYVRAGIGFMLDRMRVVNEPSEPDLVEHKKLVSFTLDPAQRLGEMFGRTNFAQVLSQNEPIKFGALIGLIDNQESTYYEQFLGCPVRMKKQASGEVYTGNFLSLNIASSSTNEGLSASVGINLLVKDESSKEFKVCFVFEAEDEIEFLPPDKALHLN